MSLKSILDAESVAVVGASRNQTKRGYQALRTLQEDGFEGAIYPVNPREKSVMGMKCYANVSDIEGPVDLVLITTPAASIPNILVDCGKKKVAGAVVIAGGFRETGDEGRRLEREMVKVARAQGIRLIGPNTSGMMNLKSKLNLVGLRNAPQGDIALLSQSGNMALSIITEARVKSRRGFTYYVGVGNESDIRFHEYLEFFRDDPDTKAIVIYVEGMREGRSFLQEAYQTTMKKPVILLKSGRTATGKASAGSHTGALAGLSAVAMGAFRRAGIITVEKSDELFPAAETLSSLPHMKNNNVAILADGGGHATIAADILTEMGLNIPVLSDRTQEKLRELLPGNATVRNPVDVAGGTDSDPSIFADCAEILLTDRDVGGLLIVGLFGGYGLRFTESLSFPEEDAAHRIGKLVRDKHKPVVMHSLFTYAKPHSIDLIRYYGIPAYDSLEIACRCMGVLGEYGQYLHQHHSVAKFVMEWGRKAHQKSTSIIQAAREQGRRSLLEHEAKAIFKEHGVSVPDEELAASEEEAIRAAEIIGFPVALKIVSKDILHKSEAGGVKLGLKDSDEVEAAYRDIMARAQEYKEDADILGVLVSPMIAEKGVEVIVGTKLDDQFGPIMMFGLGGIHAEVLKDVTFRVLPISQVWAKRMPEEIRGAKLLNGYRGQAPADKKALIRLLLIVSEVAQAYKDIQEIDLNPVILHEEGLSIADARVILREPEEE